MKTYICAAHAGGQGKTTVSQMIFLGLRNRKLDYSLVSADFCDDSGRSKLGKFYPDKAIELGIGAQLNAAKAENDANAALRYWDRFGQILLTGRSVIDVGANVVALLKQWAQHRNAHRILQARNAPPIDIILVCKAEKHAVQDVAELVRSISSGRFVPFSNINVVLNEVGGGFGKVDVRAAIAATAPGVPVRYFTLPRCTSELWPRIEQTYTSIERTLSMSDVELAEHFDIDIWSATAGHADLVEWAEAVDREFHTKGLFRSEPLDRDTQPVKLVSSG